MHSGKVPSVEKTRAIYKARAEVGGLEMREKAVPEPGPNEVLIRNRTVAVCGTDLHIYNWDSWSQGRVKTPRILGHEFAGTVAAVGPGVTNVRTGDYVSGEGHLFCGWCERCRSGEAHVCRQWKGLGYDVDGAFSDYFIFPARNVWPNDPGLSPALASIQDPLGNAVHAVFSVDCVAKTTAVVGCGPVGLLAIAVLKAIGAAQIFAFDRGNEYRLDLARKLGAHHVVDTAKIDMGEYIRKHTDGFGLDVVIEAAGAPSAILSAIKNVRAAGNVVLVGIPNQTVAIDVAEDVVFRAIHIHSITGRRVWDTWQKMAGLFKSGGLKVEELVTHSFPFAEYEKAFELMRTGNCGKVVLTME